MLYLGFRRLTFALLVLFLGAAGCGSQAPAADEEPPSAERIATMCEKWASVSCRKNQECAGSTDNLPDCVANEKSKCIADTNEEASCSAQRISALESCAPRLEQKSCDDYCNDNGFCFYYCPYFCPTATSAPVGDDDGLEEHGASVLLDLAAGSSL